MPLCLPNGWQLTTLLTSTRSPTISTPLLHCRDLEVLQVGIQTFTFLYHDHVSFCSADGSYSLKGAFVKQLLQFELQEMSSVVVKSVKLLRVRISMAMYCGWLYKFTSHQLHILQDSISNSVTEAAHCKVENVYSV